MLKRLLGCLCWLPFVLMADDNTNAVATALAPPKYATDFAPLAREVNNPTDFVNWAQANKALLGMADNAEIVLKAAIQEPNGYSLYRIQQNINGIEVFAHQSVLLFLHGQPVSAHKTTTSLPADAALSMAQWLGVVQKTLQQQQIVYDGELRIKPVYWPQGDKLLAAAKVDGKLRYQQTDYPYTLFISAGGDVLQQLATRWQFSYQLVDADQMCSRMSYSSPTTVDDLLQLTNAYIALYEPASSAVEASTPASQQLATLFDQVGRFMAEQFGSLQYDTAGNSPVFALIGGKMFHYRQGASVSCAGSSNDSNAFFMLVHDDYGQTVGLVQVHAPLLQNPEVIMHELAHGIVAFSSGLVYQDEPGALNEAFADIAGVSFVAWMNNRLNTPENSDWAIRLISRVIRDFRYPNRADNNPDHYLERYTGAKDHGGVHINSSIVNHAFYLLAEGGAHRRLGGVEVPKLGMQKALKLWHYASTKIMTPTSDFRDARYAIAEAAEIIYGKYSAERTAVHKAFDAVGIKGSWTENIPPAKPLPQPKPEPKAEPKQIPLPEPIPEPKADLPALPEAKTPPALPQSVPAVSVNAVHLAMAMAGLLLCYGLWLLLKRARPGRQADTGFQPYQYRGVSPAPQPFARSTEEPPLLYFHTPHHCYPLRQAQLRKGIVVGRADDAAITVSHASVSSQHLRITKRANTVVVEDIGSSYGTKLEGKALPAYTATSVQLPVQITLADLKCVLSADAKLSMADKPETAKMASLSFLQLSIGTRQVWVSSMASAAKPFSVGRAAENDAEVAHPSVSSHHGCIFYQHNSWYYRDLGSSYGSAITRNQQQVKLQSGEPVSLDGVAELYLADFCIAVGVADSDGVVKL
ncbi:M4 family metallopeptidase [Alishewanella tabrizica]|uniref:FHA domain-containing protein n=1 Tax=Alishewanella tabrizica TaxID=671278 RepID=A0ABQ2WU70_9ALTE|nr:M4 family metallopeptidase [Alishewanella tabrizica]GGW73406.1 hypothetical protein GCM10008111_31760 [Alishewanella tabrizica]